MITSPWHSSDCRLCLNYSRPESLLRHEELLTGEQVQLLRLNLDRIEGYPDKFGSETYKIDSSLVAMCDVANQHKICRCGIPNERNPSGRCSQPKFCEHCARVRQERSVRRFSRYFHRGAWCHAILSWEGYLVLDPGSADDALTYWEAASAAVRWAVGSGWVMGAHWTEQLHLEMLWPVVLVNPHAHALLHARNAGAFEGLDGELAERMSGFVGPGGIRRQPDILLKPVEDRHHHSNVLQYLHHPAKLAHVYVRDWDRSGRYSREAAAMLNLNLQEYFYAVTAFSFDRHTVHYCGNLDSHRREFIGRRRGRG